VQKIKVSFLLPLRYNNGSRIPDEIWAQTYRDLITNFEGVTKEERIRGGWIDPIDKVFYEDENSKYWVICEDTTTTRKIVNDLKDDFKSRFNQKDILVTISRIETI